MRRDNPLIIPRPNILKGLLTEIIKDQGSPKILMTNHLWIFCGSIWEFHRNLDLVFGHISRNISDPKSYGVCWTFDTCYEKKLKMSNETYLDSFFHSLVFVSTLFKLTSTLTTISARLVRSACLAFLRASVMKNSHFSSLICCLALVFFLSRVLPSLRFILNFRQDYRLCVLILHRHRVHCSHYYPLWGILGSQIMIRSTILKTRIISVLSPNDHSLTQQSLKISITALSTSWRWNEVSDNVKGEIREEEGRKGIVDARRD